MSVAPSPRLGRMALALAPMIVCAACKDSPAKAPETWRRPGQLRPAKHAGSWYPGTTGALRTAIDKRLQAAPAGGGAPIVAMIGPHAGLRFSGHVAAFGYAELARQKVDRVFLLGPSHSLPYSGVALPAASLRGYATPLGDLLIDHDTVDRLRGKPGFGGPADAHRPEHSLEMHAIFIAAVAPTARLVPIVVGRLGDTDTARAIAAVIRDLLQPGDVVIASSDFTHYGARYGYVPFSEDVPARLAQLLSGALAPILAADLARFETHLATTGDTICGREPVRLLLAMLPGGATAHKLSDDTSGRMLGDFSNSVTYLTAVFRRAGGWPRQEHGFLQGPQVLDAAGRALALRMARTTLETYLATGRVPADSELGVPANGALREAYGAFVTLSDDGKLRGCIGHIFPVLPLWQAIRDNAISAAVSDRRFEPVTRKELDRLDLELSVLTRPADIPGPDSFQVGKHGIVLGAHGRRAVFLPQVAPEQGWDRDTTLTHLARKAGLPLAVWRTPAARFQVFEAQVFAEHEDRH